MTYTTSSDDYAFFVVGGNSGGTDTGRVYLAMRQKTGTTSYTYALFDSGQNATHYLTWTHSSWTSSTMIVLGNPWLAVSDSIAYFNATFDAMVSAGIGGSVLYDKVTIL